MIEQGAYSVRAIVGITFFICISASSSRAASLIPLTWIPSNSGYISLYEVPEGGPTILAYDGNRFSWTDATEVEEWVQETDFNAVALSADGSTVTGFREGRVSTWSQASGFVDIDDPILSGHDTTVNGISGDGRVVFGLSYAFYWLGSGFRWDAQNGIAALPTSESVVEVGPATHASRDGSVITGYTPAHLPGQRNVNRPYIWTEEQGTVLLGPDIRGVPRAISEDGRFIVGSDGFQSFLWDSTVGARILETESLHPEVLQLNARDVSNEGRLIVGSYSYGDDDDPRSGTFIWDPENGAQDFRVWLAALGVDLGGWESLSVRRVSDDGLSFLVGGWSPEGESRLLLLVIPEPSTAALLAVGLMGLALRRS